MYAVIRTGGKQYRVAADQVLTIERLEGEPGTEVVFDSVLAVDAGEGLKIGTPLVGGAKVTAEIVKQTRGPQLIVFKKKRRQHYRRKNGHRQDLTQVKISGIQAA
jgi:large subunit ribosomal protein L21